MSNWHVQNPFSIFGTSASPLALTGTIATDPVWSNPFSIGGMQQMQIKGEYVPLVGQTNRYLNIVVFTGSEESNVFQVNVVQVTSSEQDVYATNNYIVPGNKTTTGGNTYTFNISVQIADLFCAVGFYEDSGSNNGTAWAEITLSGT